LLPERIDHFYVMGPKI